MLKQTLISLLISAVTASSFAYTIGQELTVTNNTEKTLQLRINKVNNQPEVTRIIPAYSTIVVYTENGDNSGYLYQYATAPFLISNESAYSLVRGNIAFYVGGTYRRKFSFLNALSAAKGVSLSTNYSCAMGDDGTVFQNKIVISGTPLAPAVQVKDLRQCTGLISSSLDATHKYYTANCSTQRNKTFYRNFCKTYFGGDDLVKEVKCTWILSLAEMESVFFKGKIADDFYRNKVGEDTILLMKEVLDKELGSKYCHNTIF